MSTVITPIETASDANAKAVQSSMLNPRFYTTDFDAMDRIDVSPVRHEWDQMMKEYEGDNNHDHFQRDAQFADEVATLMPQLSPEMRQEFLDFLVSSLTSEFSGCILYNEIRKNINNPDIKQLMTYMARDESRHAGFINQSLRDFGLGIDLGDLKRTKAYTYFKPAYIFYATYLSEKIGYWRYIAIFRHLEKNPDSKIFPIFNFFENWCQDENRHGDFFNALMKAQPDTVRGPISRLWCRFFLLAVFATMYVRDHQRPHFHKALGVDTDWYGHRVFEITTTISRQTFPLEIDIDHPSFFPLLRQLVKITEQASEAKAQGGLSAFISKVTTPIKAGFTILRLFMIPTKKNELKPDIRLVPTW